MQEPATTTTSAAPDVVTTPTPEVEEGLSALQHDIAKKGKNS
jgi:hypothetical protein